MNMRNKMRTSLSVQLNELKADHFIEDQGEP